MNIAVIGPQGCGKTTQAQKIANRYRLQIIELGDLVRQKAHTHSQKAVLIDHLANQKGKLIPDGLVINILSDRLYLTGFTKLLLDGYPRTINQYYALTDLLHAKETKVDACIYINISDEEAIRRVQNRRICPICHQTYNLILEPNRTTCSCSATLIKRSDDEAQAISVRLMDFHQHTTPILEQMKKDQILIEVNGLQAIEAVFTEITTKLDTLINQVQIDDVTEQEPDNYRTLFVITHSESDFNRDHIFTGRLDSKLSEEGIRQAQLASEILRNEKIDVAIRTSLTRTKQTLEAILKYHPEAQVLEDDRFIERDYGELSGQSKDQYAKDHPDLYPTYHRSYDTAPPGGESMKQVEERVVPALKEIIHRIQTEKINVLIVAHGNSVRPIRRYFENLTSEQMMALEHMRHQIFTYKVQV